MRNRRHLRSQVTDFTCATQAMRAYDSRQARREASERTARRLVLAVVAVLTFALIYSL